MGLSDYKINSFSKPVSALADTPQMSAAELKEWFDSNSANELKNSVNGIIDELKDVDVSKQHIHNNKDILDSIDNQDITKFDVSKQHSHANKDILDNITQEPIYNAPSDGKLYARKDGAWSAFDEGIPSIVYTELDNFTDGVCKIVPKSPNEPLVWDGTMFYDGEDLYEYIRSEMYALCVAYEIESDSYHNYHQMLIFADGMIYIRSKESYFDYSMNEWTENVWSVWTPFKALEAYDAERADKAEKDFKGNVIADTYATKDELSTTVGDIETALDTYATKDEVKSYVDASVLEDVKGYIDETVLEEAKSYVNEAILEDFKNYAVKSEKDLIDSSSIRLYGVKNNQDVFEAPRSNTSSSEANETVDKNATGYDRFLEEDVYIYQNTIMRRDDQGRCSILSPVLPKHIANKEYVDNAVGNIETALDGIINIQNGYIGGDVV